MTTTATISWLVQQALQLRGGRGGILALLFFIKAPPVRMSPTLVEGALSLDFKNHVSLENAELHKVKLLSLLQKLSEPSI